MCNVKVSIYTIVSKGGIVKYFEYYGFEGIYLEAIEVRGISRVDFGHAISDAQRNLVNMQLISV